MFCSFFTRAALIRMGPNRRLLPFLDGFLGLGHLRVFLALRGQLLQLRRLSIPRVRALLVARVLLGMFGGGRGAASPFTGKGAKSQMVNAGDATEQNANESPLGSVSTALGCVEGKTVAKGDSFALLDLSRRAHDGEFRLRQGWAQPFGGRACNSNRVFRSFSMSRVCTSTMHYVCTVCVSTEPKSALHVQYSALAKKERYR